jgi:hypothetical protein
MAERPDRARATRADAELRQNLRESGLAWIMEQVDEGLTQAASGQDQPPSAEARLATLVDAVVRAFELADDTGAGTRELLAMEDVPPGRRPALTGIEFVDPLGRETTRTLSDDHETGSTTTKMLRDAADRLRAAFEERSPK